MDTFIPCGSSRFEKKDVPSMRNTIPIPTKAQACVLYLSFRATQHTIQAA